MSGETQDARTLRPELAPFPSPLLYIGGALIKRRDLIRGVKPGPTIPMGFLSGSQIGRRSSHASTASNQPAPVGRRLITARPSGSLKTRFPIASGPQKRRPELLDRRAVANRSSRRRNCASMMNPKKIASTNISLLDITPEIKPESSTRGLQ